MILALIVALAFSTCHKKKEAAPVSPVAIIEQTTKPVEDSLKKENSALKDSLKSLRAQLKKANVSKITAQVHGEVTIQQRQQAKADKDTAQATNLCDQLEDDYRQYVIQTAYEDSLQQVCLDNQSLLIESQQAEIELHKSKFEQCKEVANAQFEDLQKAVKENAKKDRKLKRAKFFNKLFGGLAIAGAAIIAL